MPGRHKKSIGDFIIYILFRIFRLQNKSRHSKVDDEKMEPFELRT